MPAYMIIEARITDSVAFRAYAERAAQLVDRFGGRYRALGALPLLLEGDAPEAKIVISEWPDMASAERFWRSPEYAVAKRLRAGCGEFRVRLVQGVDSP